MKIAIVENEALHTENIQALLQKWSEEHHTILEVVKFTSGESFLEFSEINFDLVFMDILMDGIDGISTAHQLRKLGFRGQLVFLTAFSEYVFDGYDVQALNYLLKPIAYDKIAQCIDYVVKLLNDDRYTFRHQGSVVRIPYSQIIYFSSANHYTQIITTEGTFNQLESLRNIFSHLPDQFHFCHRTVIVNTEHVTMLKGRELVLSNHTKLPVSLTHLQDIRIKLLTCAENMR
ncbi:MAG: LytR/AlgR family response regulator transcription factor [Oscillospiraceae bacterium]